MKSADHHKPYPMTSFYSVANNFAHHSSGVSHKNFTSLIYENIIKKMG